MNENKPTINGVDEAICDNCIHSNLHRNGGLVCHLSKGEAEIPNKEFSCDKGKWQIKESIGEGNTISPRFEKQYGYPGRMILYGGNPGLAHYTDPNEISFQITLGKEEDEELEVARETKGSKWNDVKKRVKMHAKAERKIAVTAYGKGWDAAYQTVLQRMEEMEEK